MTGQLPTAPQPCTPGSAASPSASAIGDDHRAWVAGRALVILRQFYKGDEPEEFEDAVIADWIAVLEPLTPAQIDAGWTDYQRHGPRSRAKKLVRPTAGDIYAAALKVSPTPASALPMTRRRSDAEVMAERIKAGLPVPQGYVLGPQATDLLARGLVTPDELAGYKRG